MTFLCQMSPNSFQLQSHCALEGFMESSPQAISDLIFYSSIPAWSLLLFLWHSSYYLKVLVLLVSCTQISCWLAFSSFSGLCSKYYLGGMEAWSDSPNIKVPLYSVYKPEPSSPSLALLSFAALNILFKFMVFTMSPFQKKRDLISFILLLCH